MDMLKHIEELRCIAEERCATMYKIFEDERNHNIATKLSSYSSDIEDISDTFEEINKRENAHESND